MKRLRSTGQLADVEDPDEIDAYLPDAVVDRACSGSVVRERDEVPGGGGVALAVPGEGGAQEEVFFVLHHCLGAPQVPPPLCALVLH